jgi:5-methyltetrahydropteroyltriglutamate--homocysteine methyltransferase
VSVHAEHVGSLLRPPELMRARAAHARGELDAERLRQAEDEAALAAIALQRDAGMEVFTDGEMRRKTWMAGVLESLGGVVDMTSGAARVGWHRDRGEDPPTGETDFDVVAVNGKLSQRVPLTSVEAAFVARHAPGPYKITMMSSAMGGLLWRPGISEAVYPTPADMLRDLAELQVREIEGLIDQGVRWIQLDSLAYNQVIDDQFRRQLGPRGAVDPRAILDTAVRIDSQLVGAARGRSSEVTIGLHMCRGNNRSAWMAQGSYEPVAERLFGEVDVDRFLLEYDTDRAGGFEPLRFVPGGKTVVLGLVSSKFPELESKDDLRRRIDQAARYVPLENLALSPQCGFASNATHTPGNVLTGDAQRRKLELVAETARLVWG